jgi:Lipocalin-like domain
MSLITGERRKIPNTDVDRLSGFRTMFTYTGPYMISGDKITVKVDVAWHESWVHTGHTRTFRIDGGDLIVETAPAPSVNNPAHRPAFRRGPRRNRQRECLCPIRALWASASVAPEPPVHGAEPCQVPISAHLSRSEGWKVGDPTKPGLFHARALLDGDIVWDVDTGLFPARPRFPTKPHWAAMSGA